MAKQIGEVTRSRSTSGEWNVQWTIKDVFSKIEVTRFYESPPFSNSDSVWLIRMHTYADADSSIRLWLVNYRDKYSGEDRVIFSFGVKTADGTVQRIGDEISHNFIKIFHYSPVVRFLTPSRLRQGASALAPSGDLTLTCDVRMQEEPINCHSSAAKSSQEKQLRTGPERTAEDTGSLTQQSPPDQITCPRRECQGLSQLSTNLKDLYLSKRLCDATLKVKDKEFSVHRCVLTSRSPVFAAMFEADMKEKRTGVVDIPDCHPDVFGIFLKYIYSGVAEDLSKNVFDLYRIADKYGVEELKLDCIHYATNNLSVENLIDAVILGHEFGERELSSKVQAFFNEQSKAVFCHDNWISFMTEHPALVKELLLKMSERN